MSHAGICCDCEKPFYRRRRDTQRCKLCIVLKERADQRRRNARRTLHHRCKDCHRRRPLNGQRLCLHCSQTGDLPAELIEARLVQAEAAVKYESMLRRMAR